MTTHLALVGPTASGKSSLALHVAAALSDVESQNATTMAKAHTAQKQLNEALSAASPDACAVGNLAIHIERELFGPGAPRADFQGRTIRGLTVEQHLKHLREGLLPVAERCGRVMREALAALDALSAGPSRAVERSRPLRIVLKL